MAMATTEPTLTEGDLTGIAAPTLVLAGDDDLIKLSHTSALYEALPAGQLAIVPGTWAAAKRSAGLVSMTRCPPSARARSVAASS